MERDILRNHCLWQKSWTGGSSIAPIQLQNRLTKSSARLPSEQSDIYKQNRRNNKEVHIPRDNDIPRRPPSTGDSKSIIQSARRSQLYSNSLSTISGINRPWKSLDFGMPSSSHGSASSSKSKLDILQDRRNDRTSRTKPWTEKVAFGQSRRDGDTELKYKMELPSGIDEEHVKQITRKYVNNTKYGSLYEIRQDKTQKNEETETGYQEDNKWMWEKDFQLWLQEKNSSLPRHERRRDWAWEIERTTPRKELKSAKQRGSSRPKSIRWDDHPHADFYASYHYKRLRNQRRIEAVILIQKVFRGWYTRDFLRKLKRKVLIEHGCSWKKFVGEYRDLIMRVQQRYGIPKPSCGLDLKEIAVYIEYKRNYENCFNKLSFGGKLPKDQLEEFFNECGLFPTEGEISSAFNSVFKGNGSAAEIVFLMDCSTSVGSLSFFHLTKFVKDVVNSFEIAPDKIRVGVIPYSDDVYSSFGITRYNVKHEVTTAIDEIQHKEGLTRTDLAIEKMKTILLASRPGVRKLGVVITDGKSSDPAKTKRAAKSAHEDNIEIIVIGVGKTTDENELINIASSNRHVFQCCDYQSLGCLRETIAKKTCLDPITSKPTKMTEKCRSLTKPEVMEIIWTAYPPAATGLPALRASRWIRPVIGGTEAWSLLDRNILQSTDMRTCLRLVIQAKIEREGFITLPSQTADDLQDVKDCDEALKIIEKWMAEQAKEDQRHRQNIISNM